MEVDASRRRFHLRAIRHLYLFPLRRRYRRSADQVSPEFETRHSSDHRKQKTFAPSIQKRSRESNKSDTRVLCEVY